MLKSASEIISESFQLYVKNWRNFVPYMLVIFLPTLILSLVGVFSSYLEVFVPATGLISSTIIIVLYAASFVITIWATIALIRSLNASLSDQTLEWKENFKVSNHLILPVIITSIMVGLIVLGGSLLFVIPGIIFSIWYSFATYPVILDNIKGLEALGISKSLVVGRWAQIAWRIIVIGFIFALISILLSSLTNFVVGLIPMVNFLKSALSSLLGSLVSTILVPLSTAGSLILYYSAKANPVGAELPPVPPKI